VTSVRSVFGHLPRRLSPFITLYWLSSNFSTYCRYIALYGNFTCPIRLTACVLISQHRWIVGYIFLFPITCRFDFSFVLYLLPWPPRYARASARSYRTIAHANFHHRTASKRDQWTRKARCKMHAHTLQPRVDRNVNKTHTSAPGKFGRVLM
jgi:hypothetical protein